MGEVLLMVERLRRIAVQLFLWSYALDPRAGWRQLQESPKMQRLLRQYGIRVSQPEEAR